jgi:AAHS family 4-hydroxybenzoate transporter-like MFS transporter
MSQPLSLENWLMNSPFSRFNLMILIWSFLALLADGFDLAALASAAPALGRAWHIARADFAPALSASVFGILLGAPLLGVAVIVMDASPPSSRVASSTRSARLSVVWARNLDQVMILRRWRAWARALDAESDRAELRVRPRRSGQPWWCLCSPAYRSARFAGRRAALLIPKFGWQIMFWIGGLAPLALTAALLFSLPESVRFLALRTERRAELIAIVRAMRPDLSIEEDVQFRSAHTSGGGSGLQRIFRGSLAWITR